MNRVTCSSSVEEESVSSKLESVGPHPSESTLSLLAHGGVQRNRAQHPAKDDWLVDHEEGRKDPTNSNTNNNNNQQPQQGRTPHCPTRAPTSQPVVAVASQNGGTSDDRDTTGTTTLSTPAMPTLAPTKTWELTGNAVPTEDGETSSATTDSPTGIANAVIGTPTHFPSPTPTQKPSIAPTKVSSPTTRPTSSPTATPSVTLLPTSHPTNTPTTFPTSSSVPTESFAPTLSPTATFTPTVVPTAWEVFADQHERDEVIAHKCKGMTTVERTEKIIRLVKGLSGNESLMSARSPHFRAFNWLNRLDDRILCPGHDEDNIDDEDNQRLMQRFILSLFYFATTGSSWTLCSADEEASDCESGTQRWLNQAMECDWYGVTCNDNGVVTHLHLPANGLNGYLPVELFNLKAMQGFSVGHNGSMRGQIPAEISQWSQLVYLDLDDNDFDGPFPNVYNITTLQAIDLNNNRFSGAIDSKIGELAELVVLQIEHNRFEEALPMESLATSLSQLVLFSSQGNPWKDPKQNDWEILCEWVPDRRAVTSPGYLQFLLADCDREQALQSQSRPICSCCSVCF